MLQHKLALLAILTALSGEAASETPNNVRQLEPSQDYLIPYRISANADKVAAAGVAAGTGVTIRTLGSTEKELAKSLREASLRHLSEKEAREYAHALKSAQHNSKILTRALRRGSWAMLIGSTGYLIFDDFLEPVPHEAVSISGSDKIQMKEHATFADSE